MYSIADVDRIPLGQIHHFLQLNRAMIYNNEYLARLSSMVLLNQYGLLSDELNPEFRKMYILPNNKLLGRFSVLYPEITEIDRLSAIYLLLIKDGYNQYRTLFEKMY